MSASSTVAYGSILLGMLLSAACGSQPATSTVANPTPAASLSRGLAALYSSCNPNQAYVATGADVALLPDGALVNNSYQQAPGCYIACYQLTGADEIVAVSLIRLAGAYSGRVCRPTAYGDADISGLQIYKDLCHTDFSDLCAMNQCWAGGDTGGFLGLSD